MRGYLFSFDRPEVRRQLAGGLVTVDIVYLGEVAVLRVSHAPGWRWSKDSAPEVGAERCPNVHVGLMLSGRLAVEELDGSSYEAGPGELVVIPPDHDAWTVGVAPAVLVQFGEGAEALGTFGITLGAPSSC
jgi:hypothetical protein